MIDHRAIIILVLGAILVFAGLALYALYAALQVLGS